MVFKTKSVIKWEKFTVWWYIILQEVTAILNFYASNKVHQAKIDKDIGRNYLLIYLFIGLTVRLVRSQSGSESAES